MTTTRTLSGQWVTSAEDQIAHDLAVIPQPVKDVIIADAESVWAKMVKQGGLPLHIAMLVAVVVDLAMVALRIPVPAAMWTVTTSLLVGSGVAVVPKLNL